MKLVFVVVLKNMWKSSFCTVHVLHICSFASSGNVVPGMQPGHCVFFLPQGHLKLNMSGSSGGRIEERDRCLTRTCSIVRRIDILPAHRGAHRKKGNADERLIWS